MNWHDAWLAVIGTVLFLSTVVFAVMLPPVMVGDRSIREAWRGLAVVCGVFIVTIFFAAGLGAF